MSETLSNKSIRESSLDISEAALEEISTQATRLVIDYFKEISDFAVFPNTRAGELTERVGSVLPEYGEPLEDLIADCRSVMNLSRHNGHPRFFGYVASPSTPIGAYADLIGSALNSNVTCWRSAPAATEIEKIVVRWLGAMIGYDADAKGLLTSGGSMANMIALLIASRKKSGRESAQTGLWNSGTPLVLYASEEVHMSIAKAADILGFGRDQVHVVDCDERLRMKSSSLRQLIRRDLDDGLRPFCVVGSAGTVATGVIDPLSELAGVAREFDLWFHVDGAYGAPGSLDPRKKDLFDGLAEADSVSLDPHKWLYIPVDAGSLLFRDENAACAAFSVTDADYIQTHGLTDDAAFAFWDYGVELSRRFRALKVWLTLRYYGWKRIAQAIADDISLATYLGSVVDQADDFELMAPVELSICCFRYVPETLQTQLAATSSDDLAIINRKLDQLNEQVMTAIQRGGKAYVSNATIRGKFALRACITNFRTTRADIDHTIRIIRESGREVSAALEIQ